MPKGTPPVIVGKLNSAIAKALVQPDVKERYAALGVEPVSSTPAQLATHIRSESDKYAKLIKDADIKTE